MIPEGHTIEDIKKREQIRKDQDDGGRKKTNSRESPILYYGYLQRVERKKHLV